MIFIAFASFPQAHLKEAATAFLSLKTLPPSIQRRGPYFKIEEGSEIEIITFYEFSADYNDKAKKFLESRYKSFADVPNFSVRIEPRMDMQEALLKLQIKQQ
ncbi:MAG: hypothetical protein OEV89_09040 [Desulfobulbaceae bacterium]|nr:hypothetical protein [Desulfobulbaceae bacterium]HIJ90835.1 hypothetical protein [Deltaproteobacteria bacterium]